MRYSKDRIVKIKNEIKILLPEWSSLSSRQALIALGQKKLSDLHL